MGYSLMTAGGLQPYMALWQGAGRPMRGNIDFKVTSWSISNKSRSLTWINPTTAYLMQALKGHES